MEHKKLNPLIAGLVFAFVWIIYFMTVSPTLSFWDCGEFVACSYSLGVPHPPGTPLFVFFGKFVSHLLFFIQEKALRINLISTTGGAATALFTYLVAIRFLILGFGQPGTFWARVALYAGGIISSLCTSFAATVWFNNVEAEVYGANIALMMFANWLILKWAENRKKPGADRYIILIVFISYLNIGLHVQSLLVLPSLFLFVILLDKEKLYDWRFWLFGSILFLQAIAVSVFLWMAPIALVVAFVMMLFSGVGEKPKWRLVFWMCLVALLGYSVHTYVPVRSSQDPIIDENNPETLQSFKYFLERKQYGSESMVKQAFKRHGSWRGQLWDGGNMGYGLYHLKQFHWTITRDKDLQPNSYWNPFNLSKPWDWLRLLVYLIPTFVMFYGMYTMYHRNRESGIMFIALFITTSLGLLLYMNFKDGTIAEYPREVRERDYFYSSGFLYYMFWVGIGASSIMYHLLNHPKKFLNKAIAPAVIVIMLATPLVPLAANYRTHDRTGNYVPWDYSYNLLMSCEKDGILFTNGDNDTFPVWALQEVYGIRKDVRIANLSLLNTTWYIEQLKSLEAKVPISFSLEQIDRLEHQLNPYKKDYLFKDEKTGLEIMLPGAEKKKVLRIQDIMVLNIVLANNWKKPLYFAVTVSDDNRMGLDPYMTMEGLVFKLHKEKRRERLDVEKSIDNLLNVYLYRGLGDGSAYLNEDTRKLLINYSASFIGVALEERTPIDALRRKVEDLEKVVEALKKEKGNKLEIKEIELAATREAYHKRLDRITDLLTKCLHLVPDDWRPRVLLTEFYVNNGRFDKAAELAATGMTIEPSRKEYIFQLATAQQKGEQFDAAIKTYIKIIDMYPDQYAAYKSIADMHTEMNNKDSAIQSYEKWLSRHPGDRRARDEIAILKKDS